MMKMRNLMKMTLKKKYFLKEFEMKAKFFPSVAFKIQQNNNNNFLNIIKSRNYCDGKPKNKKQNSVIIYQFY